MSNTDCFAYRAETTRFSVYEYCDAFTTMDCQDGGKCKHHKTEEELCKQCKKAKGRKISCEKCREIRKVCNVVQKCAK